MESEIEKGLKIDYWNRNRIKIAIRNRNRIKEIEAGFEIESEIEKGLQKRF